MIGDMDIDAGAHPRRRPVEVVGREIFEKCISVASGERIQERTERRGRGRIRPVVDRADVVISAGEAVASRLRSYVGANTTSSKRGRREPWGLSPRFLVLHRGINPTARQNISATEHHPAKKRLTRD